MPPLVLDWTGSREQTATVNDTDVTLASGPHATRASVTIHDAVALEPGEFADRVTLAYQAIESTIAATHHAHVVRWWNGIPGIHDRVDASRDRYMAFNAGRFAAMRRRYGDAHLADEAPAASGVGIAGEQMVIHALSTELPGRSMQNARQRPAVRYSSRFGPLPPCFARATLATIGRTPTLFISGTAAILGEDTVHVGDLAGQMAVTLDHLRKLITDASLVARGSEATALRAMRVYLPNGGRATQVMTTIRNAFPTVSQVEVCLAELCRRDLLVEIECIAAADQPHGES